jgi:hypothetical protein
MIPTDITASLKGFGTFGTLISHLREKSRVTHIAENRESGKVIQSTLGTVPNVPPMTIPLDQAVWLPVAKQVLAHESGGCGWSGGPAG